MTRTEFAVRAIVLAFGAVAGIQIGGVIGSYAGDAAGGLFGIAVGLVLCKFCKPHLLWRELSTPNGGQS